MFNCIELLTSYAMSLFWCAFVASILKVTYLLSYQRHGSCRPMCTHTHTHWRKCSCGGGVDSQSRRYLTQELKEANRHAFTPDLWSPNSHGLNAVNYIILGTWFSNESKVQDVNDLMQHLRRRAGRGAVGAEGVARMWRESVPSPQGKGIHFDVCWRTFFKSSQWLVLWRKKAQIRLTTLKLRHITKIHSIHKVNYVSCCSFCTRADKMP